jgi:hypothetical protein
MNINEAFAKEFDPAKHPRHPAGSDKGGQFAPKHISAFAKQPISTYPNPPSPTIKLKKKKKIESIEDFTKNGIRVEVGTLKEQEAFIQRWNAKIDEDPEEFKKKFLGGVNSSMNIINQGKHWEISGRIQDEKGENVGEYRRYINWNKNEAESSFFKLNKSATSGGIGKRVLAGNVEIYKKLGIERVYTHANIDVGGYAWAKYGYIPTQSSWNDLKKTLLIKLKGPDPTQMYDRLRRQHRENTYTPESWEEISDSDQSTIEDRWKAESFDEFYDSEVNNWRDNGDALDDAKSELMDKWEDIRDKDNSWASEVLDEIRQEEEDIIPYTNAQILYALSVDYERGWSGKKDPEFIFYDDKLKEPNNAPSPDQMLLPGFKPIDLSTYLKEDAREKIIKALTKAFNKEAEDMEGDVEPPEYLRDSIGEYQSEYWDSMDDRERYRQADRLGLIPSYDIEPDEDDEEEPREGALDIEPDEVKTPSTDDELTKLIKGNNPRAIWAISDHPQGKKLLLNTDWVGHLNLTDEETMKRFNNYVGKKK